MVIKLKSLYLTHIPMLGQYDEGYCLKIVLLNSTKNMEFQLIEI